jgi:hypothetical protein
MGIEPTFVAWEATVLPLNYTRRGHRFYCATKGRSKWASWCRVRGAAWGDHAERRDVEPLAALHLASNQDGMEGMSAARKEFVEGLGLSVLALGFTGVLLYAAVVAAGQANYVRAAAFGIPGVIALYWSIRFTRAQFAAYRAGRAGAERGQ